MEGTGSKEEAEEKVRCPLWHTEWCIHEQPKCRWEFGYSCPLPKGGTGYGENFTITYDQSIKADEGKPQIALVPPQIIRDIAEVREYGLKKYGSSESWREVSVDRYINALLRHTLLFMEDPYGTDEESGIKHYKHMACNLAFLCELMKGE